MFEPSTDNLMSISKTLKQKEKKPYKPSEKEIFIGVKDSARKKTRKR